MIENEIAGSPRPVACLPVNRPRGIRLTSAWTVIAFLLLSVSVCSEANAQQRNQHRYRHNGNQNRRASAAAKAWKALQVQSIERQVANARQVLASSQSKTEMNEEEVKQALEKLSGIRKEIGSAEDDVAQARKTQREVEAEILAEQSQDSPAIKAEAVVMQGKENLHRTIHELFNLPDDEGKGADQARPADTSKLSESQRAELEKNANYQLRKQELTAAVERARQLRTKLFQADTQWAEAEQELADAHKRERQGAEQAKATALSSLEDRAELRKAEHVAAAAREIVVLGEFRLRQLGVKSTTKSGTSQVPKSQSKKN